MKIISNFPRKGEPSEQEQEAGSSGKTVTLVDYEYRYDQSRKHSSRKTLIESIQSTYAYLKKTEILRFTLLKESFLDA